MAIFARTLFECDGWNKERAHKSQKALKQTFQQIRRKIFFDKAKKIFKD